MKTLKLGFNITLMAVKCLLLNSNLVDLIIPSIKEVCNHIEAYMVIQSKQTKT